MKAMRIEYSRRINAVQMLYRHRKFGEPAPTIQTKKSIREAQVNKNAVKNYSDASAPSGGDDSDKEREEAVWKALGGEEVKARLRKVEESNRRAMQIADRLLRKGKANEPDKISDLHSIREDSGDDGEA